MILARLFGALFENGLVLVTTSNIEPGDLYEGGLNRALFLPFIDILKASVTIVELDAPHDYRLDKISLDQTYFCPDDESASRMMDSLFNAFTRDHKIVSTTLDVLGHNLTIPLSANGVARFDYTDLCKKALGANDFIAIGDTFHTVFIDHVPVISAENHNEAKRFIALIDAFYDRSVRVFISAASDPVSLYGTSDGREDFEFERTVSRLIEMQSNSYRALPHGARAVEAALSEVQS
jgi:cell division protein ZapE